jgi:glycosyltransferase involved in cell wall biosynthesis
MWAQQPPPADVLNSFDVIVVQAPEFAIHLRSLGYDGQVRALPYVPPACEKPVEFPSPNSIRVGFLGRLEPQKNLTYLLESFAALRREVPLTLQLFGGGSQEQKLRTRAGELGVVQDVAFHGAVPRERVAGAIDSCHLFAFASTTEGQCLAALEVLARGRPIVATPVGALPDILKDGRLGILAPLGKSKEYACSLREVVQQVISGGSSPTAVQSAFRERFDRESVLTAYERLFAELIRARATGDWRSVS